MGFPYTFLDGILDPRVAFMREGIEDLARPGAKLGERVHIGAYCVVAVSAYSTRMRSTGTLSSSATTCANTVFVPVPMSAAPEFTFPAGTIIPGYGYLRVWCTTARPATTNNGPDLNAGFNLSSEGGTVCLFSASVQIVDSVTFGAQVRDQSIGRVSGTWRLLGAPTPGSANSTLSGSGVRAQCVSRNRSARAKEKARVVGPGPFPSISEPRII